MIKIEDLFVGNGSLTIVITNYGMASKILKQVKNKGVTGGTILLGTGIIQNKISKFLGIDELKKEIILMVIDKKIENKIHKFIVEKFKFYKKNSGILFSIDLLKSIGIRLRGENMVDNTEEEIILENTDINKHEAIFVIVNKGSAKEVVKVATENGATGGTILHGRGAGMYENTSLFSMTIEPEKEIVMFLVAKEKVGKIINVIEKTMKIEEPGKGIIFTVPVNKAKGLYEEKE